MSPLSDRAHSWLRQTLLAGRTLFSPPVRFHPKLEFLWTPKPANLRYASSNSFRNLLAVVTPINMNDGNIYFRFHRRIPRHNFDMVLKVFRKYKRKEIADFDWEKEMWKIEESTLRQDTALAKMLRMQLREAGVHLRRLPGDGPTIGGGEETSKLSFDEAAESILFDDLPMVAVAKQAGAFQILTPTPLESQHHKSDKFREETARQIDLIIKYDLSGVTERIEHTFHLAHMDCIDADVYQTYDVWLVAEFLQLLSEKVPKAKVVISDAANEALDQRFSKRQENRKPIPEVEKVRNPGVPLHPHQIEGIRFFMNNDGRGLLGDEMGLGKTIQALGYVASTQKRAIVISPKKVLDHWVHEATNAFPKYFEGRTLILGSQIQKGSEDDALSGLSEARIVCVNYEICGRFLPYLKSAGFDTIVLDESHYIKNAKTKRTDLLLRIKDDFEYRILLSGTPIKNRVEEFVSQMQFLGMDCADEITEMSPGELWNLLHVKKLYLRRNIKVELPHLRFKDPEIVELKDGPNSSNAGTEVKILNSKGEESIRRIVMTALSDVAHFKAPYSAALAQKLTDDFPDDKVIVITERISCAESIYEELKKAGVGNRALLHHGKLSHPLRASILEAFSVPNSIDSQILVSTRPSLAVGINLQCANRVIFNDLAWTPADILQAAARTKRLNQGKEVFEYWMLANARFDINLVSVLRQKLSLMRLYGEGKNMSADSQKWMNERVTYKDVYYGIENRELEP